MTLEEKKLQLITKLSEIKNSQERFAYVVARGRRQESLDSVFKIDSFRVEGCLAKLWFVPEFNNGRCYFQVDSDSAIVKGIAVILCEFYSGYTSAEILTVDPTFLEKVGITQHLTPNRRNSLSKIWDKIRDFAISQDAPRELAA